jgi:hypothetical protein
MNMTVPATRQTGTSSERSKVSSLTTSAEPISAPRTASWPDMPLTMPEPANEPTSKVTAVELCSATARPQPARIAMKGLRMVARNLWRSTSP